MAKRKPVVPESVNPAYIRALKNQRRSLGLLQFRYKSDRNFSRWEQKTENLLIECFGEGTNQLRQYNSLVYDFDSLTSSTNAANFKPKMKDLLTNFIEELELKAGSAAQGRLGRGSGAQNIQTQKISLSINVNIDQTINNIIDEIKASEPDEDRVREAEAKLTELKGEMQSASPQWSKVKAILEWSLNFSRDVFLKILPILVEKYLQAH